MSEIRDLGFIKWKDEYAKYEDVSSSMFKEAVLEENTLFDSALKKIPKLVDTWKSEFSALPSNYEIAYSFEWLNYQINIRPDNRYILSIEIANKNNKTKKFFENVVNYGSTKTKFWLITENQRENLSLFIYDESLNLLKELPNVGESAISTDTDIYFTGARNVFWSDKLFRININLEPTLLYQEVEEKYTLKIKKQKLSSDIFLLRLSALYQDVAIIIENKPKWIIKGFGTKIPVTATTVAYDKFFIKDNEKIDYPEKNYLENLFLKENKLYFIFTHNTHNSLYLYENGWIQIFEPTICDIKYLDEADKILIGYPNRPDTICSLQNTTLTVEKQIKGPIYNLNSGLTDRGVPWFAVNSKKTDTKGLVVYGYGSYGMSLRKSQQRLWIPWINQGYTVAFLGIRGGRENGDDWWDQSRTAARRITGITDFVKGTIYLQRQLEFNKTNTVIFGRSAGGFLVTAAVKYLINDIKAVYAAKPYTDYLRTASNKEINGTVQETDEFGLVQNPIDFLKIVMISPQENIVKNPKTNPLVLLTGGTKDSEVSAYMPLKYVKALKDANWKYAFLRVENEGHFTDKTLEHREAEDAALIDSLIK